MKPPVGLSINSMVAGSSQSFLYRPSYHNGLYRLFNGSIKIECSTIISVYAILCHNDGDCAILELKLRFIHSHVMMSH